MNNTNRNELIVQLEAILLQLNEAANIVRHSVDAEQVSNANQKRKEIISNNSLRALFKTYPNEQQVSSMAIAQKTGISEFQYLYELDKALFISRYSELGRRLDKPTHKGYGIKQAPKLDLIKLNDPKAQDFSTALLRLNELESLIKNDEENRKTYQEESRALIRENKFKAVYRRLNDEQKTEILSTVKYGYNIYLVSYCLFSEDFIRAYADVMSGQESNKLSSTTRRRHRNKANKLNITVEEYEASLNTTKKTKPNGKKARRNEELRKLGELTPPDHVNLVRWDDLDALSDHLGIDVSSKEGQKVLDTIKAIEMQYIVEKKKNRLETFKTETGKYMHLEDIKSKVANILSDGKMKDAEEKFKNKVGSLEAQAYSEWAEKVYKLWQTIEFNPHQETLDYAVNKVLTILKSLVEEHNDGAKTIEPLPIDIALQKTTKGRNSGFPYFTSKWHKDEEIVSYYLEEAKELLKGKLLKAPRILFSRTQYNGKTPKMRPVECPPKSEAIAGKCFTDRILFLLKQHDIFCGLRGNDNIGKEMRAFVNKYNTLVSSDFSNFDTTCTHLIPIVFNLMKEIFVGYDGYFDSICEYYRNSTLITPQGILYSKNPNGLQSGDSWTSIMGSLINAIANFYTLKRMGIDGEFKSYGDDCVVGTNEHFSIDEYEKYMAELGMDCNKTKQEYSAGEDRNCNFLGYYYFYQDCSNLELMDNEVNIFPIFRALSGLIYREHYVTADDLFDEAAHDNLVSAEELEEAKQANKRGIDLLGLIAKLDNVKNHPDYLALIDLFVNYHPTKCDPREAFPFRNLITYLRNVSRVRGYGLGASSTFRVLVYKHNVLELLEPVEKTKTNEGKSYVQWDVEESFIKSLEWYLQETNEKAPYCENHNSNVVLKAGSSFEKEVEPQIRQVMWPSNCIKSKIPFDNFLWSDYLPIHAFSFEAPFKMDNQLTDSSMVLSTKFLIERNLLV